jgi:hypothetical protein
VRATNVRGSDQIRRLQNWVSERESRRVPGARFLLQRSSPPLPSRSLIGLGADEVATTSRSARRRSASRSAALRLIRSRNGHRTSRDRSAPPWSGNRDSTQADRGRSAAAGTIRLEKGFQCSLWVRHCPTLPDARDPRRSSFALRGDAWGLAIGGEFGSANASMPNDGSHFPPASTPTEKALSASHTQGSPFTAPIAVASTPGAAGLLFGAKRPAERAGCAADALNIGCHARCARP